MPIISKSSKAQVLELLNTTNPTRPVIFDETSVKFGTPTKLTVGDVTNFNSNVKVTGNGGVYVGSKKADYRRMDVAILTRGISVRIAKKRPVELQTQARKMYTLYELLPELNKKYGLNFTQDDFPDVTFSASIKNPTVDGKVYHTIEVTVKETSLGYFGKLNITWIDAVPSLADKITDANRALNTRLYPGGNDFSGSRKPQGEWQLYGYDAVAAVTPAQIETWPSTSLVAVNSTDPKVVAFIQWLNDKDDRYTWSAGSHTVEGGLGGLNWFRYVLPNDSIPEANSIDYNRAIVIPSVATSWFSGKLIIHYEV